MFLAAYPEMMEGLPVYVRGVGMDYPQEAETYRRGDSEDSLLLFSTKGTGEVVIDGNVCELPEGSAVYVNGRTSCRYRPKNRDWVIGWVTFGCGIPACASMLFLGQAWCRMEGGRRDEHRRMLRELYDAVTLDRSAPRASAILYGILAELDGVLHGSLTLRRSAGNPALERIIAYLNDHYTDDITLDQLCEAAGGLSEQYLCRLFKQSTGLRPMEYMLSRRVSAARVYLETTDLPISTVAARSGFHNTSYFYRSFRKFVGMSPLAYRQACLGVEVEDVGDGADLLGEPF